MICPLSILVYHRVLPQPDPLLPDEIDRQRFAQHLQLLRRWFNILPLGDALQRLDNQTLPAFSACITFDDGYRDNAEIALPLLQRYGVRATFFIATGFSGGGPMWNDAVIETVRNARGDHLNLSRYGLGRHAIITVEERRRAVTTLLGSLKYMPPAERASLVAQFSGKQRPNMMDSDQILALHRAGMEIGAHTVSHPILTRLPDTLAAEEIAASRDTLESHLQSPVRLFAYPNGKSGIDFHEGHVKMVREAGFSAAVTTEWGAVRSDADRFTLPRFTPWDRSASGFIARLLQNMYRRPTGASVKQLFG